MVELQIMPRTVNSVRHRTKAKWVYIGEVAFSCSLVDIATPVAITPADVVKPEARTLDGPFDAMLHPLLDRKWWSLPTLFDFVP